MNILVALINALYIGCYYFQLYFQEDLHYIRYQYIQSQNRLEWWFTLNEYMKYVDRCIVVFYFVHTLNMLLSIKIIFPKFSLIFTTLLASLKPISFLIFVIF